MASTISNRKVNICEICEETCSPSQVPYDGASSLIQVCSTCKEEIQKELKRVKKEASRYTKNKMKKWIRDQKVVKRFYKRQYRLPIEEGG